MTLSDLFNYFTKISPPHSVWQIRLYSRELVSLIKWGGENSNLLYNIEGEQNYYLYLNTIYQHLKTFEVLWMSLKNLVLLCVKNRRVLQRNSLRVHFYLWFIWKCFSGVHNPWSLNDDLGWKQLRREASLGVSGLMTRELVLSKTASHYFYGVEALKGLLRYWEA